MMRELGHSWAFFVAPLIFLSAPALADGGLLAETRAARSAGDYARAEALARKGMAQSADAVWPLTLALVLTDKGESAQALALLNGFPPGTLPDDQRLLALGYAYVRAGDDWGALKAYGEALLLVPDSGEARASVAGILDRLRAPYGAAALDGLPDRRAADQAAARVRWGASVRDRDPALRFEGTDKALTALDNLLARMAADPASDPALVRRIKLDRVVALRDRVRMAEAADEAEQLAKDAPLPVFARQAQADALLYLRHPRRARAAYEEVLAAEPNNIDAGYGRFFALLEAEEFAEAYRQIDRMAGARPRFVGYGGGAAIYPDREYLFANTLAAQARLWGNQVDAGFRRLQPLVDGAPANAGQRMAMAGAFGARGWPRRAAEESEIALSLAPDDLSARIQMAESTLSRHRIFKAAELAAPLVALAPENRRVQRLQQDIAAQRGWLLEASARPSFNDGGGINAQGNAGVAEVRLTSPQIADGLRLFGYIDSARAQPPEGDAARHSAGGGLAIRTPDVAGHVYGFAAWGSLVHQGVGADVRWEVDDRWSLGAAAEKNSRQTSLRALLAGITADSISIEANWRGDERRAVGLYASLTAYSDGNDRKVAGLSATRLVHSRPHLDLTLRGDLYTSGNSQPGGPYFAPEADFSASFGLSAQHVAWRRYERVFVQVLAVDFGVYDQKGYAAGWIGVIDYEHRWRHDPRTEIFYGIRGDRRVYDGVAERGLALRTGIRQRF